MQVWQQCILALWAAFELTNILWTLVRAVFFTPVTREGIVSLVCVRGDGGSIEHQLRALRFLSFRGDILVVDCGLSEEGRRLCRLLARTNRQVILCQSEDLTTYITDKENLL